MRLGMTAPVPLNHAFIQYLIYLYSAHPLLRALTVGHIASFTLPLSYNTELHHSRLDWHLNFF